MALQHKQLSSALDWRKDPDVIGYEKRRAELADSTPDLHGKLAQAQARVQALLQRLEQTEVQAVLDPAKEDEVLALTAQLRDARQDVQDIETAAKRAATAHAQALNMLLTGNLPTIHAARQRSATALQAEFATRLKALIAALEPVVQANAALQQLHEQAFAAFPEEMAPQFTPDTPADQRTWTTPDVPQSAGVPPWLIWRDLLPIQHTGGEDIASAYVVWLNRAQDWIAMYEASQKGKR